LDRRAAETLILRDGWLAAQSQAFRTAVLRKARLIECPPGGALFHVGDDPGGIYGVVDGGIGIHVPQPGQGATLLVHIARRGVWFGHGPLVRRTRRTLEFSIIEPSWLFHAPLAAMDEIGAASPANARALYSISEFSLDVAVAAVATLQIRSVGRRIAATLLRVAPQPDVGGHGPLDIVITQAQIAEMANASRDLVNRTLGELAVRSWLSTSYGKVTLLDTAALGAFAADDP